MYPWHIEEIKMKTNDGTRMLVGVVALFIMISLFSGLVTSDNNTYTEYTDDHIQQTQITDWYDMDDIRNNLAGNYVLMNDLDQNTPGYQDLAGPSANGGAGWAPLGNWDDVGFTGTFDGQGYTISDYHINRDGYDVGLFGSLGNNNNVGGTVLNLGVTNMHISGDGDCVGALTGYNSGEIRNCYAAMGTVSGQVNVGGLVGRNRRGPLGGWIGEVFNSYAAVVVSGGSDVGGLVGSLGNSHNCFWDVDVSGTTTSAGGTGLSTAEMMNIDNFAGAGWDIATISNWDGHIWHIDNGNDYPRLGIPTLGPEVETREATDMTYETATLRGELMSMGEEGSVQVFFRYRVSGTTIWTETAKQNRASTGIYDQGITGLDAFTTYEFKAAVEWNGQESIGDILTFTTSVGPVNSVSIEPSPTAEVDAGVNLQFSAEARDAWGNLITDTVTAFTWNGANNGIFNQNTVGEYEVTATYDGVTSATTTVTVNPGAVNTVTISPSGSAEVMVNEDLQFSAEALDNHGNLITDIVTAFTWNGADENGIFNEGEGGTYDVTAMYEGITSEPTTVTVVEQPEGPYFRVEITAHDGSVQEGRDVTVDYTVTNMGDMEGTQDIVFRVDGVQEDAYTDLTLDVEIVHTGTFTWTAGVPGTYTLEVSSDDSDRSVTVTVTEREIDHIVISPQESTISSGSTQAYTAVAYDEFSDEIRDVTADTSWSTDSGAGGTWNDNIYTSENEGTWTVTGTYAEHTDTATLIVTDIDPVAYILISPDSTTINTGDAQEFFAMAYDENDVQLRDVTDETDWSIEAGAGGGWDDNIYTSQNTGEWTVTGIYGEFTNTAVLVVIEDSVDNIVISPSESTISAGDVQEYTVIAFDELGNQIGDVSIYSEFEIIVNAGGNWEDNEYTGEFAGTWTVTATYGGATDSATLTVLHGSVDAVEISPSRPIEVIRGMDRIFSASAYDEFRNLITNDVNDFTWDGANENGVFNENTLGEYRVTAAYQGTTSPPTVVTVVSAGPPQFEFFNLRASPRTIQRGHMQEIVLSLDVENTGDEAGVCKVRFYLDGTLIGVSSAEIDSGEVITLGISHYEDGIGIYNVTVEGMVLMIEIVEMTSEGRPLIRIFGFIILLIIVISALYYLKVVKGNNGTTLVGLEIMDDEYFDTADEEEPSTVTFECPICGAAVKEEDTKCPSCMAVFMEDEVEVMETEEVEEVSVPEEPEKDVKDPSDEIFDPDSFDEDDLDAELGLDD